MRFKVTIIDPLEHVAPLIEKFDINLGVSINQNNGEQHVIIKGTLPSLNVKVSSGQVQRLHSIANVVTGAQIAPLSKPTSSLASSHSLVDSQEFPPSVHDTPIDLFGSHPSSPPLATTPAVATSGPTKRGPKFTAQFTASRVWFTALSEPFALPLVRIELSRLLCIVR